MRPARELCNMCRQSHGHLQLLHKRCSCWQGQVLRALQHLQAESWAFAADAEALELLAGAGVFSMRTCKLCDDGVVVMGEYGLSTVLLNAGHNIATLMSMCACCSSPNSLSKDLHS